MERLIFLFQEVNVYSFYEKNIFLYSLLYFYSFFCKIIVGTGGTIMGTGKEEDDIPVKVFKRLL